MRLTPVVKDVLLVGAGHAHVAVLRAFGMRPIEGVRLTLLTREIDTPYSGMLPGLVAGHYHFEDAHIDAGLLARFAGARLYHDEATGLDLARRSVLCRNRPPIPYDLLSLDIGARPDTAAIPGAAEHAIPVKPIDGFLAHFDALLGRARSGASKHLLMVGGGAGGIELLLAVQHRIPTLRYTIVAPDLLASFPSRFQARFRALMTGRGITIVTARVAAVEAGAAILADQTRLAADEILWTTEAGPAAWLAQTGLPLDQGFLRVDAHLRAAPDIFAAGDMISFRPRPIPRSGVYAVRAGPILAHNLRATLTGRPLRRYRPQAAALAIVTTGPRQALLARNGMVAEGEWVWRLKDWIDRRWMARYQALPDMPLALAMRCGGCGAKVGAATLQHALARIGPAPRADIVVGLDPQDDAAIIDTGGPRLSVHTVDYFRANIDDPYRFGMIAANHALGDIYAMGATPQSALAIATLPYGIAAKVESDLADLMQGANEILAAAGCALVGGHTSEGAELALGFALNGQIARDAILRKSGLQPGDALILTKPIGTGTLLAATMRGQAKTRWIEAAITHMTQSSGPAAAILARHHAHAATDVTGFGLLGHLLEMTRASAIEADLALSAIPILDGADATAAAGLLSSLQPANLELRHAIENLETATGLPRFSLLFDPQTAGPLLAGLPAEAAQACLAELHASGYPQAAVIGAVKGPRSKVAPIRLLP